MNFIRRLWARGILGKLVAPRDGVASLCVVCSCLGLVIPALSQRPAEATVYSLSGVLTVPMASTNMAAPASTETAEPTATPTLVMTKTPRTTTRPTRTPEPTPITKPQPTNAPTIVTPIKSTVATSKPVGMPTPLIVTPLPSATITVAPTITPALRELATIDDVLPLPARFKQVYRVEKIEDVSFGSISRIVLRISLPMGLSQSDVELNLKYAVRELYTSKHPDAIEVFAYRQGEPARGVYSVAHCTFAPYGKWERARPNTPLKVFKPLTEFNEAYFKVEPSEVGQPREVQESINGNRITVLTYISLDKRKKIFFDLVKAQDEGVSDEYAYVTIAKKYGLKPEEVGKIAIEGAVKSWPMPELAISLSTSLSTDTPQGVTPTDSAMAEPLSAPKLIDTPEPKAAGDQKTVEYLVKLNGIAQRVSSSIEVITTLSKRAAVNPPVLRDETWLALSKLEIRNLYSEAADLYALKPPPTLGDLDDGVTKMADVINALGDDYSDGLDKLDPVKLKAAGNDLEELARLAKVITTLIGRLQH